jgi:hypothetical protein
MYVEAGKLDRGHDCVYRDKLWSDESGLKRSGRYRTRTCDLFHVKETR